MPPDTATILIIDTIYQFDTIHLIKYDTISQHLVLYDTIRPELMDMYSSLLIAQNDRFDWILAAIGIIVTVLVILVTVHNLIVAREVFKRDAKKAIKKEVNKYDQEIRSRLNAEVAALAAMDFITNKRFLIGAAYFFKSLSIYSKIGDSQEILNLLEAIHNCLLTAYNKKDSLDKEKLVLENCIIILDGLPHNLNRSNLTVEIKELLNEILAIKKT